MTLAELRDLMARVTYKPGWSFTLGRPYFELQLVILTISFEAPDATNPSTIARFSGRHALLLDDIPSERGFLNRLRSYILHIETHELNEFLKVDGIAPFDPHLRAES